ncbi:metallophosphoesterase [Cryomorpha ignava]|uniref:Metallophosphoesterase n=1 Tax=Cryomorpha ignava TaxID=101383 RepID=A0A7K3WL55_9FLAO|nr:metallophosphoesterase [Cryomorpha ignava]NEN22224.1 metallophosphoesterase [Cryomorpha ignava]
MKNCKIFILYSLILGLAACQSSQTYYRADQKNWQQSTEPATSPVQTIYFIGDAGKPSTDPLEPSLALLKTKLEASNSESTSVVFLGDNIYEAGLHPEDHLSREEDEQRINAQLDILKDFQGRIIFVPGNHDWHEGKKAGDEYVQREEKYIEEYLNRGNTFLPDNGCGDPVEIELNKNLVMIAIDTQWWLHKHDKPQGESDNCTVSTNTQFLAQIDSLLLKNKNNQVIIVGHHPLYTNGNHGGYFTWKDHIFPLTNIRDYLYIPLPIIGSLYPLYRSELGNHQDIPHKKYTALVNELTQRFNSYENIIYTAGHEHGLQYQQHGTAHYVVSGSGSKSGYLKHNDDLAFGTSEKGFARIELYQNGAHLLEYFLPDSAMTEGNLIYSKKLK